MSAVEVVGDAPPDPVELDAEDDLVAVGQGLTLAEREVLGGEHLQLERDRKPIIRPARPEAEEAFAGLEHGARGHGLEAVEVCKPSASASSVQGSQRRWILSLRSASSTRLEGLMPQPTACAVKLAAAFEAYGLSGPAAGPGYVAARRPGVSGC
jgi:hypothetical protein